MGVVSIGARCGCLAMSSGFRLRWNSSFEGLALSVRWPGQEKRADRWRHLERAREVNLGLLMVSCELHKNLQINYMVRTANWEQF